MVLERVETLYRWLLGLALLAAFLSIAMMVAGLNNLTPDDLMGEALDGNVFYRLAILYPHLVALMAYLTGGCLLIAALMIVVLRRRVVAYAVTAGWLLGFTAAAGLGWLWRVEQVASVSIGEDRYYLAEQQDAEWSTYHSPYHLCRCKHLGLACRCSWLESEVPFAPDAALQLMDSAEHDLPVLVTERGQFAVIDRCVADPDYGATAQHCPAFRVLNDH